jgi:lipopolysaccharide biosynthesis regulator YciM
MTDTYHAAVDDIGSAAGRRRAHELNGLIAMKTKDFTTAVKELEQADLHDSRILYRLAVACEAAGDEAAGRRWRQQALDTNPMDQLGHALVRRKLGERMANM